MSTLEDYETKLNKAKEEIVHIVSAFNVARGVKIALCGFDCTGRKYLGTPDHKVSCVVCVEMYEDGERLKWLDSISP